MDVVEFEERIRRAVWGLAVTVGVFGWTLTPWAEHDGKSYSLWALPGHSWVESLLMPGLAAAAIVLGVACSAAPARRLALAAWLVGVLNAALIGAFETGSDDYEIRYGVYYAHLMVFPFIGVFVWMWWTARKGKKSRKDQWMDPGFGTVDKRTRI